MYRLKNKEAKDIIKWENVIKPRRDQANRFDDKTPEEDNNEEHSLYC